MKLLAKRRARSKHADVRFINTHTLMDPAWDRTRIAYRCSVGLARPVIPDEWGAYGDRLQTDEMRQYLAMERLTERE